MPTELGMRWQVVARNVASLRRARGWSAQEVANRCADIGFELPRSVLANLENGRRGSVSVDELWALAEILRVEPWSLTADMPICQICRNNAPAGFACLTCGHRGQGAPSAD